MSWVKLDDKFADHPKIAALSDRAFRVHVDSICYAAQFLTDGFVPRAHLKHVSPKVIAELVVDLWEACPEGYWIHDYLDYNPSRKDVQERRSKDLKRKGFRVVSGRNPRGKTADS